MSSKFCLSIGRALVLGTMALIVAAVNPADAGPLTITSPFFFRSNTGVNPLGLPTGDVMQLGAFVSPSGPPTVVTATQGLTTFNLTFTPHPIFPNDYEVVFPYDQALTSPWTINAVRGSESASPVLTPAITSTEFLPLVDNLRVVGVDLTPTLMWEWPDLIGIQDVTYGVRIIDYDTKAHFFSQWLYPDSPGVAGTTGMFEIPDGILEKHQSYIFRVSLLQIVAGGQPTSATYTQSPYSVPEPDTFSLAFMGLLGFLYMRRRVVG